MKEIINNSKSRLVASKYYKKKKEIGMEKRKIKSIPIKGLSPLDCHLDFLIFLSAYPQISKISLART